jgi:cysteine desulfuration protein SufE
VWLILGTYKKDGVERLSFLGDSDALIVKGLIAIVGSIYDNIPLNDISNVDPYKMFESLELLNHLSSQRANGLNSMIKKIQNFPNV